MRPDDQWADIAETVPGGFAGIIYDQGKPAILLTHPEQASTVKQVLASRHEFRNFDIQNAKVIKVRWDFAQLVDWYNYLMRSGVLDRVAMSSGDKNEGINRIRFGVETESDRRKLVRMLTDMGVPCDLITVGVEQVVQDT
jgi:hypothetical protein